MAKHIDSTTFTEAERSAFAQMQARLIALLLRHDIDRFQSYISRHAEYQPDVQTDHLQRYRELAVLFFLRDELFEHILPRIVRRLSFVSPRTILIEEPPPRGRVDWNRTLDAVWQERPNEPPLLLHTRQRRRNFATPENLLTVVTLLEYRADVQHLLWDRDIVAGDEVLRHPLNEIVTRCDRELAFPQFASLLPEAQQYCQNGSDHVSSLEKAVETGLLPGSNSAYAELLAWRNRRKTLQLLQRDQSPEPAHVLGADPNRDNYLYQLWIFYELVDMMAEHGALDDVHAMSREMRIRFRWENDSSHATYELRHDQSVPNPVVRWQASSNAPVPGIRPDFYLWRIDPPQEQVVHDGNIIWREPGVLWDAKYYREREQDGAPSPPIKRMIADLTLLGESYGALLFALLKTPQSSESTQPDTIVHALSGYELTPMPGHDQTIIPDMRVGVYRLLPDMNVRQTLQTLLKEAHERLAQVRTPECHGRFLEQTVPLNTTQTPLPDRYSTDSESHRDNVPSPTDFLICPKLHIGAWRVDIVSRTNHCCQDPYLCHIVGRPNIQKPVRPPRTIQELLDELQQVFDKDIDDNTDEEIFRIIVHRVETITRHLATVNGVYDRIQVYINRLRDLGMDKTLHLLGKAEQESLALAMFLVEQLDSINANDYSAPAIHIGIVMEIENRRRIFACPNLVNKARSPRYQTLGSLRHFYDVYNRDGYPVNADDIEAFENWERITTYAATCWNEQFDTTQPERIIRFEDYVKQLTPITHIRNKAAHSGTLPRDRYQELLRLTCQFAENVPCGVLNALLLAWRVPEERDR